MTSATGTGTAAGSFVATLGQHRIVAVVRHRDTEAAAEIARACIAGGLSLVEITLTVPDAPALVADLVREAPDGVVIGAGTVLGTDQVDALAGTGAGFLVSPITDPDVMAAASAAGVPFVPGAATPSEIHTGARLGAPVVKLFPADRLGPSFLAAVATVLPDVALLPSGGIGIADLPAWLDAGAFAVALGGELGAAHARGGPDAVATLATQAVLAAARPDTHHRVSQHRPQPARTPS